MKRTLLGVMAALALGWTGGASAQDPRAQPRGIAPVLGQDVRSANDSLATAPRVPVRGNGCQGNDCGGGDCGGGFHGLHFYAGGGIYLIQPNFETNPSHVYTALTGGTFFRRQNDFRYNLDAAPQLWLGVVGENGLGARVRWFQYDQGAHEEATNVGDATVNSAAPLGVSALFSFTPGGRIVTDSGLYVAVWDFEVTQDIHCGAWDLTLAGGVRYAHVAQNYNAFLMPSPQSTFETPAAILSGHNFNGAGPSVALDARRRIANTGLALYGSGRGAILFGSAEQVAYQGRYDPATGVLSPSEDSASNQSDVLPIAELELGLEYSRIIGGMYGARVFEQIGFVGQVWFGAGNAANNEHITGTSFPDESADNSHNFGFVGMAFRLGVHY